MLNIAESKELAIADTPLILFDCTFSNGLVEHWSTHKVSVNGNSYDPRVLKQNLFEMQYGADLGVDTIPKITLDLANADSYMSEIESSAGFKGGQLTVSIVFFNFPSASATSNTQVLFKGVFGPPDSITEQVFRVSSSNRLSLQRALLPPTRIQRRCPWTFPVSVSQRQEAVSGGTLQDYSRFYNCGYSPDQSGGVGNFGPDNQPYTSCALTRSDCTARGMFSVDSLSRTTARFGGMEFVPPTIAVRSAGEKGSHSSPIDDNEARYNDFIPLIYGTAWYAPGVVFSRNDGNLTHFELVLGMGQIQSIQTVLVEQIEIPPGQPGQNMTGTGWYNLVSSGTRNGGFNLDFTDANGNPLGDPYGSIAYLSVVVPNRINDGSTLPNIQVLLNGLILNQFGSDGSSAGSSFTNNPAWIVLDILMRIGWQLSEIDLAAFASAAAYCAEQIQATDLFGNAVVTPRFQCNLVLKNRRAASDVIRGIRNACRMFLRYGSNGLLQLSVENSIALQQPSASAYTNAIYSLNGGWPAYEFGDGSSNSSGTITSGIARLADRSSSLRLTSNSTAETPNRFTAEFQDAFNDYQQDSFSVVDVDDVTAIGQEITSSAPVLGLPHFDQAARILQFLLDKSVLGNRFVSFQTSAKALGLSIGDIISVTYAKENYQRQPFRVVRIQPGTNYRTATITAQWHDDSWYDDTNGQVPGAGSRRQLTAGLNLPKPLGGVTPDGNGNLVFGVVESTSQTPDGAVTLTATVSFSAPSSSQHGSPDIPLVSLQAQVSATAGTLAGGQDLFYALTSVGADGTESNLSYLVHAHTPNGSPTNSVTLSGLSFPPSAASFNVYRGITPQTLTQIAGSAPLAASFVDPGLSSTTILPPDPNYDHADFYWRMELQPPTPATIYTANTIGSSLLELIPSSYSGMTVRIVSGTGMNQERVIATNGSQTVNLTTNWDIIPDATSTFVIAQSTFQFGATTQSSPAQFTIPNQAGIVVQISGRSANANGDEAPYEISPLTRWTIGGAGIVNVDSAVPPAPSPSIALPDEGGGMVVFLTPSFPNFNDTATVTAGTYTLYYIDELNFVPAGSLAAGMSPSDTQLTLTAPGPVFGSFIYIDQEVLGYVSVDSTGTVLTVTRAAHQTVATAHLPGAPVYSLLAKVFVVPYVKDFFGTAASGDWNYPVSFPNVRVISAELALSNSQGSSPKGSTNFVNAQDGGLRTLSGGQFSFQIAGFLAIRNGAAPDIIVDSPKLVRDIYAVVKQPAVGAPIVINLNLNGSPYASLTIPAGATTVPSPLDGGTLGPMQFKDQLSIDIVSVGLTQPGSDLSVILRV